MDDDDEIVHLDLIPAENNTDTGNEGEEDELEESEEEYNSEYEPTEKRSYEEEQVTTKKPRGRPRKTAGKQPSVAEPAKVIKMVVHDVLKDMDVYSKYEKITTKNASETRRIVKKGIHQVDEDVIANFVSEIKACVSEGTDQPYDPCASSVGSLEKFEKEYVRSTAIRDGLNGIVQIAIAVVDLLVLCNRGLFSKTKGSGLTLQIQMLMTYFSMVRSSQDLVVDADMDVAILEKIVKSAKTEDLAAFRIWFLETFGRQNGYRLNNNDHSTEFKAFILVVSLTLINVEDEKGEEEKDLLPFLKTLLRKPTFSNCHNAVGTIYFGISNNPAIANLEISVKSMKYKNDFNKYILKKVTTSENLNGLRCLQFLSIVTLFEIVSFCFVDNYEAMMKHVENLSKSVEKITQITCPLPNQLKILRENHFQDFFLTDQANNNLEYIKKSFQTKYGSVYFIKMVVLSCKAELLSADKIQAASGQGKKRKATSELRGANWQEENASNILNAKVTELYAAVNVERQARLEKDKITDKLLNEMNEKISALEKAGKRSEKLGSWRFSATQGTLEMMAPKLEEAFKFVQAAKKPVRLSAIADLEVVEQMPSVKKKSVSIASVTNPTGIVKQAPRPLDETESSQAAASTGESKQPAEESKTSDALKEQRYVAARDGIVKLLTGNALKSNASEDETTTEDEADDQLDLLITSSKVNEDENE